MSQNTASIDPYQLVTDIIFGHLGRGIVPWRCPWRRHSGRPRNFHTGKVYQGINVLLLGIRQFASPHWMTFRQAKERGGSVRKGEHGSLVLKYGRYEKDVTAENGTEEKKPSYYLKGYKVFNAVQIDGIEFPEIQPAVSLSGDQRLFRPEQIVAAMPQRPEIHEGRSDRACYRQISDSIEIPARGNFQNMEDFYLTLFHELIHYAAIWIMPRRD